MPGAKIRHCLSRAQGADGKGLVTSHGPVPLAGSRARILSGERTAGTTLAISPHAEKENAGISSAQVYTNSLAASMSL